MSWDVIYQYTREQAIEDGVLVDVTKMAQEAGFNLPVAVTSGVWGSCVEVSKEDKELAQDEAGRLWDVLFMCYSAIRASTNKSADELHFKISLASKRFPRNRGDVELWAKITGEGPEGAPVMTIMLQGED